jgi:hypothetical protein
MAWLQSTRFELVILNTARALGLGLFDFDGTMSGGMRQWAELLAGRER